MSEVIVLPANVEWVIEWRRGLTMKMAEREIIIQALTWYRGSYAMTARALGIPKSSFYTLMGKLFTPEERAVFKTLPNKTNKEDIL